MQINKRCMRCLKVLRANGTCQNEKCVKYVKEEDIKPEETDKEKVD